MKPAFLLVGIILGSWLTPATAFLREHWQEMERTALFDGLNFYVVPARK